MLSFTFSSIVIVGQALQFLAVGHKIQIGFLRNAEKVQKKSDEI
jgi:hypothetical protein